MPTAGRLPCISQYPRCSQRAFYYAYHAHVVCTDSHSGPATPDSAPLWPLTAGHSVAVTVRSNHEEISPDKVFTGEDLTGLALQFECIVGATDFIHCCFDMFHVGFV